MSTRSMNVLAGIILAFGNHAIHAEESAPNAASERERTSYSEDPFEHHELQNLFALAKIDGAKALKKIESIKSVAEREFRQREILKCWAKANPKSLEAALSIMQGEIQEDALEALLDVLEPYYKHSPDVGRILLSQNLNVVEPDGTLNFAAFRARDLGLPGPAFLHRTLSNGGIKSRQARRKNWSLRALPKNGFKWMSMPPVNGSNIFPIHQANMPRWFLERKRTG